MVAKETNHHVTTTKSFLAINLVIRATTTDYQPGYQYYNSLAILYWIQNANLADDG